jgi:hypothetical protein
MLENTFTIEKLYEKSYPFFYIIKPTILKIPQKHGKRRRMFKHYIDIQVS